MFLFLGCVCENWVEWNEVQFGIGVKTTEERAYSSVSLLVFFVYVSKVNPRIFR